MAKILFLSIIYSCDKKNIYTDLVEELVTNKHNVTVISSISKSKDISKNYKIIGFQNIITGKQNLIKKGLDTIFIGRKFTKTIKLSLKNEKFDLILYATPPITLNGAVKYAKKIFSCKSYLMLKDIFPQNAVDLQMFKKYNPIYWYFRYKEKKLYRLSDYIGCMSQGNIDYLLYHNNKINKSKVGLFCNSIKINHDIDYKVNNSDETTFIFGGNLGKPQNIAGLLKIIDELKDYPLAKFIFVGKGACAYLITDYISDNSASNIEYYDFLPKDKYDELLLKSDVGIISLDARFTIPNIPSKLPSYMNLHKPVFAMTDTNTDLKDIIFESNCGWWCDASNLEVAVDTVKYICEHKEEHKVKGIRGYKYLCEYYDVKKNVKQLEEIIGVSNNESI